MKRIIAAVMIILLVFPGFAAASGSHGGPGGEQVGNSGTNTTPGEEQRVRAEENTTLRSEDNQTAGDRVQQRVAENATVRGENIPDRNQVRLAVQTLLAVENRTDGIGRNVSAVAREFDNSVRRTLEAEEQIRTRHGFMRFLFGGDEDAARVIEAEAQRNRERVAELLGSIENCTCDNETRTMLREQVRTIEQEQDRLTALAKGELRDRGLFSWK